MKQSLKHFITKSRLVFVLTSALFVLQSQARADEKPKYLDGTCIVDANDPFEPNVRIQEGDLKGECVDPTRRRSVLVLPAEKAAKYFSDLGRGDIVVANFSHDKKFWLAKIPLQQASKLIMQIEYFPVLTLPTTDLSIDMAHTQLRVQFAQDAVIELKAQNRSTDKSTEAISLREFVFSIENVGTDASAFDVLKGMQGYYNVAYRAVSMSDKIEWMVTEQDHKVAQYQLKVSEGDVQNILSLALDLSTQWKTNQSYNSLHRNCMSELFDIIDNALGIASGSEPFYPNAAKSELEKRNILDESVDLKNLKEEINEK